MVGFERRTTCISAASRWSGLCPCAHPCMGRAALKKDDEANEAGTEAMGWALLAGA